MVGLTFCVGLLVLSGCSASELQDKEVITTIPEEPEIESVEIDHTSNPEFDTLSGLSVGNNIATASVLYEHTPSINYYYNVSENVVASESVTITSNRVEIEFESPILRRYGYTKSDVYLYRYNWSARKWTLVNFTQSSDRSQWSGWGVKEEVDGIYDVRYNRHYSPTLTDHDAPEGWNIYYVFVWSLVDSKWKTDGWIKSKWTYVDN